MDEHIPVSQWVCINELKGIQFKYLENEQSLNLQVPASMLSDYSVDLTGQPTTNTNLLKMKPLNAAILNYSMYHTITNDESISQVRQKGFLTARLVTFHQVFYITAVIKTVIAMRNGCVWKVNGNM